MLKWRKEHPAEAELFEDEVSPSARAALSALGGRLGAGSEWQDRSRVLSLCQEQSADKSSEIRTKAALPACARMFLAQFGAVSLCSALSRRRIRMRTLALMTSRSPTPRQRTQVCFDRVHRAVLRPVITPLFTPESRGATSCVAEPVVAAS